MSQHSLMHLNLCSSETHGESPHQAMGIMLEREALWAFLRDLEGEQILL